MSRSDTGIAGLLGQRWHLQENFVIGEVAPPSPALHPSQFAPKVGSTGCLCIAAFASVRYMAMPVTLFQQCFWCTSPDQEALYSYDSGWGLWEPQVGWR